MADLDGKGKIFTGARARFYLNGVPVGYATNVSGTEEIQYDDAEVLDRIEVAEQVPTAYRVSMRASFLRIVGKSVKARGWMPSTGKNSDEHLLNILNAGDLTARIEDSATNTTLYVFEQVKAQNNNWTINARGIVGEDVDFVAIRMKDESDLAT